MREILFKAKRIDNGEWVEGCYAVHKGKIFIGVSINETFYIPVLSQLEVTSETLCQFTGLCDKNGNKIWENDILMVHLDGSYPEDATYETVEWNVNGWGTRENGSVDREYLGEFDLEHYEVVGNIFDNKELLQEESDE